MNTKIIKYALSGAAIMLFLSATYYSYMDDERWFLRYAMSLFCFASYGIIQAIEEKK